MQKHIYRYQLGEMTLTIISEGILKGLASRVFGSVNEREWRPLVETDANGRFALGMNIVHVAMDGYSALLDTGIGEPHPSRIPLETSFPLTQTARLIPSLAEIGVLPEQVTTVVFSHAHGDHIMGATRERDGKRVPSFPNARYLLMDREWAEDPARKEPDSVFNVHIPVLQQQDHLQLVKGECEVAPAIRMIPAPGESPGHAVIRMESVGKTAFYLGDLFHHPAEAAHLDWVWPGRDKAQMQASRRRLVDEALDKDAVLITAHMPFPGMGKLRRHNDSIEWVVNKSGPETNT